MAEEIPDPSSFLFEFLNRDSGFFYRKGTLLEKGESQYQQYEVYDTPQFGRLFRLDGFFMTSEQEEFFYHENLVHVPAITHPAPERALVIGGGDGGSSEELLKHPTMKEVVLVELDDKVIEIASKHLQEVHHRIFGDPRLVLEIGDGREFVRDLASRLDTRFDLIILDLTDPIGPAAELYSPAFFRDCAALLTESGALALHIGPPVFAPDRVRDLVKNLQEVFPIVRPYFLYIPLYGSLWGMASASAQLDPRRLDEAEVERRLLERKIPGLKYYNGATHHAVFAFPNFIRNLLPTRK